MVTRTDRRLLLGWMFKGLGWMLILGDRYVARYILFCYYWAKLLFGKDPISIGLFLAAVHLSILVAGLLCLIAASGLRRGTAWGHLLGILTSAILLLGFPLLTLAGGFGLYVLLGPQSSAAAAPPAIAPVPTTDYWTSKRKSKAQTFVLTILGIATWPILGWFFSYAHRVGMPVWRSGIIFWGWYSLFLLLNTSLHECGHAIVAWAAGFNVRVVSIGPFTFYRDHSRVRIRIDLTRMFETGGYMGAVPVSDEPQRLYQIAVVAAGPLTNALTCLVCLDVFFSLPGTAWQAWWWIPAMNAVFSGIYAISNLVPLGYCDGAMLFHLILGTRAGMLLLEGSRYGRMEAQATECHHRADFDKEIEIRETMLQRALELGKENSLHIVACHHSLGWAYVCAEDWPSAEFQFRKCLEFAPDLANNLMLAAGVWSGLHNVCFRRLNTAQAAAAYQSVIAIYERRKNSPEQGVATAAACGVLAGVHERAGAYAVALPIVEQGLQSLPRDSHRLPLQGHLFRTKAMCLLNLGETEAGLAAARSSADAFRSPEYPPEQRNLAWEDVADLGKQLWRTGQSALPIEFLREAIAHLESGGALPIAAQYRIQLASIFRQLGRLDDARAELPAEEAVSPARRRAFLAERAELRLAKGSADLAAADCRELLALWTADPRALPTEIASAKALFAAACLATGDPGQADSLAEAAADVLGPAAHPDTASCLITLALAREQTTGDRYGPVFAEALRLIDTASLLTAAEKARYRAAASARIESSEAAHALAADPV